jgi:hypothetical protein
MGMWNLYYYSEFEKLLKREDDWNVTEDFKMIYEHRDPPEKYWNQIGKKVLEDYYKQERCC